MRHCNDASLQDDQYYVVHSMIHNDVCAFYREANHVDYTLIVDVGRIPIVPKKN